MTDPLSDPRAADLLSADPGEVWSLAGAFRRIAGEAESTAAGLRGAQGGAVWTGAAASAFRSEVGQLPGELDKVRSSYQGVADALDAYEGELASVRSAFQRVAQQLGGAQSSLSSAQGQLSSAQGELSNATAAPHATAHTPAVRDAHDAVQAASGAVGRVQAEVSGLEAQGFALLDRFQVARDYCQGRVAGECSAAPHQSWWDHAMHDVGNWMHDVGHFGAAIAKGVWHGVIGLPGALVDFIEHPSFKTFLKLAEDVAITASVVLLVTGVGELLLPEEAMAAGILDSVSEGADAVSTFANTAQVAGEDGQAVDDAAHGNFSAAWDDVANGAIDAASGAVPDLGDFTSASQAAESAEASASVLGAYSKAISDGLTPAQALGKMTSDERSLVLEEAGLGEGKMADLSATARAKFLHNLDDPDKIAEDAEKAAKLANIKALPLKNLINFAQDKAVVDPLGDYGKDRVAAGLGVGGDQG
jgi:uncharacterized protein YukE